MLRLALWFLAIFVPLQMVLGDMHGLNTLKYQPAKLAAMEGLWGTGRGVPASIIGWPDMRAERDDAEIAIPKLGSLYLTHSWDGEVKGLKDFPPDERPPVSHRIFRLQDHGRHRCCDVRNGRLRTAAVVAVARGHDRLVSETLSARFSARVHCRHRRMDDDRSRPPAVDDLRPAAGRQIRVSPSLTGFDVLLSLLLYVAVYLIMYPVGLALMLRIVRAGPAPQILEESIPVVSGRPQAPIQALPSIGDRHCDAGARPDPDLDGDPRPRRILVCGARRLRSRRRHPLPIRAGPGGAEPGDELDRPDLGRQRDLVGPRRYGPSGSVSRWPSPSSSRLSIFQFSSCSWVSSSAALPSSSGIATPSTAVSGITHSATGPLSPAFAQGLVLGTFIQGFRVEGRRPISPAAPSIG